eukprot:scaffold119322_cov33-Tisochrysis_lutea.AAC.2
MCGGGTLVQTARPPCGSTLRPKGMLYVTTTGSDDSSSGLNLMLAVPACKVRAAWTRVIVSSAQACDNG